MANAEANAKSSVVEEGKCRKALEED